MVALESHKVYQKFNAYCAYMDVKASISLSFGVSYFTRLWYTSLLMLIYPIHLNTCSLKRCFSWTSYTMYLFRSFHKKNIDVKLLLIPLKIFRIIWCPTFVLKSLRKLMVIIDVSLMSIVVVIGLRFIFFWCIIFLFFLFQLFV